MQDISNTSKLEKQSSTEAKSSIDISQLFDNIEKHITLPVVKNPSQTPPAYVVRLIFIYGRSQCKLEFLGGQEVYSMLKKIFFTKKFDLMYDINLISLCRVTTG